MKVKSESEVAQSCLTLHEPMHCSLPGSSIHGIFQARVLEGGAIAFSVLLGGYNQRLQKLDLHLLCQVDGIFKLDTNSIGACDQF